MTVAFKNDQPLVVPPNVLRRAGFKRGQELEVRASGGMITIVPKTPGAGDEYTPEQRRNLDARLKKAIGEVDRGQTAGPFDDPEAMIASLKQDLKKSRAKRPKRRAG